MEDVYEDGFDLQRDMLRYSVDSWIRFNLESETYLHIKPNDVLIILPTVPYDDEEQEIRKAA